MSGKAERSEEFKTRLQQLQIIIAAMCGGVVVFLMVGLYLVHATLEGPLIADQPILITGLFILFAAACAAARTTLVPAIARRGRLTIAKEANDDSPSDDAIESRLTSLLMQSSIIGAAMTEAAAFLLVLAYIFQGHWVALAAAFMALVALALQFPNHSAAVEWLERQKRMLEEDRAYLRSER